MTAYRSFSTAWLDQLEETIDSGHRSNPRGLATLERRWVQFEVTDPMTFPVAVDGRKFADVISVLEGLSLVGQTSIPEGFTSRVRKFGDFMDHGVFHGAYGTRVYGRLGDLVELLKRDPDTRQAVLSIYDSRSDLGAAKRDIPCTLSLHFQLSDGGRVLEQRVTMRSNDMWLGTPYDFAQFAILQASLAQALDAVPGLYVHSAGSLHVYERDLDKASGLEPLTDERYPHDMGFPLWGGENDIAAISSRARLLLLYPGSFETETEFEAWAKGLLLR